MNDFFYIFLNFFGIKFLIDGRIIKIFMIILIDFNNLKKLKYISLLNQNSYKFLILTNLKYAAKIIFIKGLDFADSVIGE